MPVKGTIPVVDERYDLTSGSGAMNTAKTALGGAVGFAMLFGIVAGGRALWNRASETTDRVSTVEVF